MIALKRITAGSLLFLAAVLIYPQEELQQEVFPNLKDQTVILEITARIVDKEEGEVWNSFNSKVTIQGQPVGLKVIGENIVVAVQFIHYLRRDGSNVLVALGQIWMKLPEKGISYQTTMQTINMDFGEQVYFFPLGEFDDSATPDAQIEIQVSLKPYTSKSEDVKSP